MVTVWHRQVPAIAAFRFGKYYTHILIFEKKINKNIAFSPIEQYPSTRTSIATHRNNTCIYTQIVRLLKKYSILITCV